MCAETRPALAALNKGLEAAPLQDGHFAPWQADLKQQAAEHPMVFPERDDVIIPQRAIQVQTKVSVSSNSWRSEVSGGWCVRTPTCREKEWPVDRVCCVQVRATKGVLVLWCNRCCVRRQTARQSSPPAWDSTKCGQRSGTITTCRATGPPLVGVISPNHPFTVCRCRQLPMAACCCKM